jgi:hypothetical protein
MLSIQHEYMGLLRLTDSSVHVTYPVDPNYAKTTVYRDLAPIFGVPQRRKFKQLKNTSLVRTLNIISNQVFK